MYVAQMATTRPMLSHADRTTNNLTVHQTKSVQDLMADLG
ncbi:hypothetical protein HMPREF0658_1799 [Hoylesella marshii DSM 16973 = JCM 13450]|uniref:Uncharacterized protein n=1 Tax=Hoylesella marshii DSM 16973 = JCM 13450 TaxID=862515 RepID=E0NUE6_9BACT|nr:hypothetical protein HMPREF0658_1799 [Hoylesella marshii DSM 16973 = JCM 13450]